ncbi:MAG: DUF4412 domain-containing protein [Gammaproteobacteria bacterium]|nr:DUF4412 domain-containing protein [Gammaproteobacteria bacterium]
MTRINGIKTVVFAAGLTMAGVAQAFVGSMAVGLGEMNDDVGRINTSFAADANFETEEMTARTRIFYKPGKVRDEIKMDGQEMVMIRRFDLNKFWMIMGQGMYMDIDPEQGNDQAPQYKLISREVIGPETVNGIPTTKYKSVYESSDGKFGGFTWFTDDNIAVKGFLVHKTKGEKQRFKFEFTSLKRGAQGDSLFEIPPGYKKFNMGGMPGMGMMQPGAAPYDYYGAPAAGQRTQPAGSNNGAVLDEYASEAQRTAEESAKRETMREVQDSIRKGIGNLFGR